MKYEKHKIKEVLEGSIAQELEIQPGEAVIAIDGHSIEDMFDYYYFEKNEKMELLIETEEGEPYICEIEKEYGEELGLVFESELMDSYQACRNKCVFCFIDQMPGGMRESLYFKDDDSRLSFLYGNYVTLTNMSKEEIQRVINYKMMPINISIHTMNPKLRCQMLHNRFAGEVLSYLDDFYKSGTLMNGQIVLCKGLNDGEELEDTLKKLMQYHPIMQSVSIVPVGLTKYRENLYPLEPFTKEDAEKLIQLVENYQKKSLERGGNHFIHASDEWYILAERPFPDETTYDGYLQLENGVGMMRMFWNYFLEDFEQIEGDGRRRTISIATAKLAYPVICEMAKMIEQKFPKLKIYVYCIENQFFGENITVSGLLTGRDIVGQLRERELGEILFLPSNVLKADEDIFLDDMSLLEVQKTLQVPVDIVQSSGEDFLLKIIATEKLSSENLKRRVGEKDE